VNIVSVCELCGEYVNAFIIPPPPGKKPLPILCLKCLLTIPKGWGQDEVRQMIAEKNGKKGDTTKKPDQSIGADYIDIGDIIG
jgi:hypothetical protein